MTIFQHFTTRGVTPVDTADCYKIGPKGLRLDQTGLYYYNARYYDSQIGRFISPDASAPDPLNSQSRNRYAYAINNPTKCSDPSGRDYIIMCGNNQKNWREDWKNFIAALPLKEGEQVYVVPDSDTSHREIEPRMADLLAELEGKSDIKFIGFSEGASTVCVRGTGM